MALSNKLQINTGIINRFQKSALDNQSQQKPKINEKNKIVVIPYMVVSGTTILTDTGEYRSNENLDNYGQRKVLWNGKDNIILIPKGWGKLVPYKDGKPVGKNLEADEVRKIYNTVLPDNNRYYFNGLVQSHIQGMEISDSNLFNDIKQTQNMESITMIFTNWNPDQNELEFFYEMPEISANTWYKIESASVEYVEGEYNKTIITFTSINDELSSSGRAIDQYFHRSAPGEGFPRYNIKYNEKTKKKEPILDPQYLKDIPITSVQIELFGTGIINSITCLGRKATNGITNTLKPSHILFNSALLAPITTRISKTSLPVSTFYMTLALHTDVRFYYKDIQQKWNSYYNEQTRPNTQGMLAIETSIADLRKTNIQVDKSSGNVIEPPTPILSDKAILATWTNKDKIWDENEITLTAAKSSTGGQEDNKFRLWVDPTPLLATKKSSFNDSNDYHYLDLYTTNNTEATATHTKHDWLNILGLAYWDTLKLPLDMTTVCAWTPSSIPVIGGLFNSLGLGKVFAWQSAQTWTPSKLFGGLIPSITAEYFATYFNQVQLVDRVLIPFGALRNNTDDTSVPLAGIGSQNTTIRLELTDLVGERNGATTTTINTIDLGQGYNPKDGTWSGKGWGFDPKKHFALKINDKTDGFLIDAVIFKAIAKCNYRITFWNDNDPTNPIPVWQGRYMTESKWDNMDRSWTNFISFSPWNNNLSNNQSFTYPKPYKPGIPPKSGTVVPFSYSIDEGGINQLLANTKFAPTKDDIENHCSNPTKGQNTVISYSYLINISDFIHVVYPANYQGDPFTINWWKNKKKFIKSFGPSLEVNQGTYVSTPRQTWNQAITDGRFLSNNLDSVSIYYGQDTNPVRNGVAGINSQSPTFTFTEQEEGTSPQLFTIEQEGEWWNKWKFGESWRWKYGSNKFNFKVDIIFEDDIQPDRINWDKNKYYINITYTMTFPEPNDESDNHSFIFNMYNNVNVITRLPEEWNMSNSIADFLNNSFINPFLNSIKFNQ